MRSAKLLFGLVAIRVVDVNGRTDYTVGIPQPRVIVNDSHSAYIGGDTDYFAAISFTVYDTGLLVARGHLRNTATFTGFRASFELRMGPEVSSMWRLDRHVCDPTHYFTESMGAGATDLDVYRTWERWIPYDKVTVLDGTGQINIW